MRPPLGPSLREGSAGVRHEPRPAAGAELTSSLTVRLTGRKAAGPVAHAGTGGATLTNVELDQATRDELQPPCEHDFIPCWCNACRGRSNDPAGRHAHDRCSDAAESVVSGTCQSCGRNGTFLLCGKHTFEAVEDARSDGPCPVCGDTRPYRVTTDRLR